MRLTGSAVRPRRRPERSRNGWSSRLGWHGRRGVWSLGRVVLGLGLAGCSLVPKSRLDECHRLSQTLQAENARLKDTTVSLRSQNQDLTQRAVDDARRLRLQERGDPAAGAERLGLPGRARPAGRGLRADQAPGPDRRPGPARSRPARPSGSGSSRGPIPAARSTPVGAILTLPTAQLFEPGTDRLRPEARAWLQATRTLLDDPEARDLGLSVVGRTETPAVRRAGLPTRGRRPRRWAATGRPGSATCSRPRRGLDAAGSRSPWPRRDAALDDGRDGIARADASRSTCTAHAPAPARRPGNP